MADAQISDFLMELGLTEYEAKTLGSLFTLRESEAPEVSRVAQVPKTRVYDVLERLVKKGLIIEIYGRPKKYKIIEPSSVFNELLNRKRMELKTLEAKASELDSKLVTENGFSSRERVMKVKDKSDFDRILSQEISKAKNSVFGFSDIENEHSLVGSAVKNALGNQVEVKLISKIVEGSKKLAQDYSDSGAELRHFEHGMRAYVIDDKKVVLGLSNFSEKRPEYHFTIWDDNKTLVSALKMYFDDCWQKSKAI